MNERDFQSELIKEIKKRFEGSIVLKNDGTNSPQGMPDLTVLYKDRWAALECKRSNKASVRPNQKYYVDILNGMSFSRFVTPENKEEVLDEMGKAFGLIR